MNEGTNDTDAKNTLASTMGDIDDDGGDDGKGKRHK